MLLNPLKTGHLLPFGWHISCDNYCYATNAELNLCQTCSNNKLNTALWDTIFPALILANAVKTSRYYIPKICIVIAQCFY